MVLSELRARTPRRAESFCRANGFRCTIRVMVERNINEIDIWTAVISPEDCDMSAAEANAVLRWRFNDRAKQRMEDLAARNGRGVLTAAEKAELEAYVHVGEVIGILQAKARLCLKRTNGNGSG